MKPNFPRWNFTCGITNLTLLTAEERAGVPFILALLAASRPGATMLKKWQKIKRSRKRGQKVNAELDENGNAIVDGEMTPVETQK